MAGRRGVPKYAECRPLIDPRGPQVSKQKACAGAPAIAPPGLDRRPAGSDGETPKQKAGAGAPAIAPPGLDRRPAGVRRRDLETEGRRGCAGHCPSSCWARSEGGQRPPEDEPPKKTAPAKPEPNCPSWARTRTLLIQSQACCQLHQGAAIWIRRSVVSGAEGDRTPDLRIANAALSQLSYCPVLGRPKLIAARSPSQTAGLAGKAASGVQLTGRGVVDL